MSTSKEVLAELTRIAADNDGILKPADVVAAAKPVSSPLHSRFEWDDSEAAEKYRLWQARQLIAVTVEYIGSGEQAMLSRVFVSLTPDRQESGYRTVHSVMADPGMRERMLADARIEMERFEKKYAELNELAEVFDAMRRVRRRSRSRQSASSAVVSSRA